MIKSLLSGFELLKRSRFIRSRIVVVGVTVTVVFISLSIVGIISAVPSSSINSVLGFLGDFHLFTTWQEPNH